MGVREGFWEEAVVEQGLGGESDEEAEKSKPG